MQLVGSAEVRARRALPVVSFSTNRLAEGSGDLKSAFSQPSTTEIEPRYARSPAFERARGREASPASKARVPVQVVHPVPPRSASSPERPSKTARSGSSPASSASPIAEVLLDSVSPGHRVEPSSVSAERRSSVTHGGGRLVVRGDLRSALAER